MRAVLPGRPRPKLQALSTASWDGLRIVAYISGHALIILRGAQELLQTIYVDETESLEAVTIDEVTGRIAVCGGPDIFVYQPYWIKCETLKWSLAYTFRSERDDEIIQTLSWGCQDELLAGSSSLMIWLLSNTPHVAWEKQLANLVKFSQFSPDAELIATTGYYDRLVKIWRRLAFGADSIRFEVSYLPHPAAVTGVHWRKPYHRDQSIENILYTICADKMIRVWTVMDHQAPSTLQLWAEIDMYTSIQPRDALKAYGDRRYGFIIDSRDFCAATERAVQQSVGNEDNPALEHIIEVANKTPEICVIIDDRGYVSAWGLENIGCKAKSPSDVFNILHVEGLNFSFVPGVAPEEDYAQFSVFGSSTSEGSLALLVHYFDGRIEWLDSKVDTFFDPTPRQNRLTSRGIWSGHTAPIKKIVRNASGHVLVSRTDDNNAMIWRQKTHNAGSVLVRQSSMFSDEHIHRTCVIGNGKFLVNLHHESISLWDVRSCHAERLALCDFQLSSKLLCILLIPTADRNADLAYVATVGADMNGIAWEIHLPSNDNQMSNANGSCVHLREFCKFSLGLEDDLSYILPVDPAGQQTKISGFLDLFAADIALSYTLRGTIHTWAAKVDRDNAKIEWLLTSTVETGIANLSLASGSSIRKAAVVDEGRTHLTIWDTSCGQLEFEEHFSPYDIIRDLDWTSTPDMQSILAVGFPHKVILLSQLRYDYLDSGPSWTQVREIWICDLTPHPIGDSCWLSGGNLVVGAGNQLFVYDKEIEINNRLVAELRIPSHGNLFVDLFDVVSRLNGPLPVFHPQFLAQCILGGKMNLVHYILMCLHQKLKFYVEGDELDSFLELPLENFYRDSDALHKASMKEMQSSYADLLTDNESLTLDENIAAILNENLTRVALPQLSSQEQFRLADTIECVATVEKHRRSMDDNAARYLLFFRQHMLRRSQGVANSDRVTWREIIWAFHSGSQDILIDLVSRQFNGKMLWKSARESGVFMWLSDATTLRAQLEIVARNEYMKTEEKNPTDCSLYYLALGKKNVLQRLWRMASWHPEQSAILRLLANNFQEPRWRIAALKNAYVLLGKRRFEYAAAFFLLADHLRDAVNICINKLGDIQLAITIIRAYEGDDGPTLHEVLEERVLVDAASEGNRWLASWAFWMLNRRDMAVRSLISPIESLLPPTPASPGSPAMICLQAKSYLSNDPALIVLYKQLREKTLQTLKGATRIPPIAEWSFILRNARLYDRMGCDLLALDLVCQWEFLQGLSPSAKSLPGLDKAEVDYRKLLKRRSSLVVADMPASFSFSKDVKSPTMPQKATHLEPPVFEEPDVNSLLDSFGF